MERAQPSWVARARALPRKVLTGTIAQVKKRYGQLKKRYGPRYTKVMLTVAFLALFSPIPGTTPVGLGLIIAVAEAHRAISRRGGFAEAVSDLLVVVKAHMPRWGMGRWPAPPF